MCCGTEAGSYLRLIDYCITQLKAQGLSRTCNESKEELLWRLSLLCRAPAELVWNHTATYLHMAPVAGRSQPLARTSRVERRSNSNLAGQTERMEHDAGSGGGWGAADSMVDGAECRLQGEGLG